MDKGVSISHHGNHKPRVIQSSHRGVSATHNGTSQSGVTGAAYQHPEVKHRNGTSSQPRSKHAIRRCASVDVAELHRKQKRARNRGGSRKNKVDQENLLSKSEEEKLQLQAAADKLRMYAVQSAQEQYQSTSRRKRPDSLTLSPEALSSVSKSKVDAWSYNNEQIIGQKPEVKGRLPAAIKAPQKSRRFEEHGSYVNTISSASPDRLSGSHLGGRPNLVDVDQVALDFSHIDQTHEDAYSETVGGYSKHGLKHNFPSAPFTNIQHPAIKNRCTKILGMISFALLAFLVFFPMAAVAIILCPLCILLKITFSCCCCCQGGDNCACCICAERLSYVEEYWIQYNIFNPAVVQSIIVVEYGLDANEIRNLIHARLVNAVSTSGEKLYPRFSQKVMATCSGYAWVTDKSFFIHNHVSTMPKGIESLEDLQEYISDMASRPLSPDLPLWEVQILSNFGDKRDTVLLFRMHPCVSDGVSMVKILYKSISDIDSITTVPPRFAQSSYISSLKSILSGPVLYLKKFACVRTDFNLLHGRHLHFSGKRVITWSEPFSLSAAMRLKQVTRTTLNEVLMSVAAGCLRNYLKSNGIPNPYNMHTIIPVYYGNERNGVGNETVLLRVVLPTNTEGAVPRLWQMKQIMCRAEQTAIFSFTKRMFSFTYRVLPEILWKKFWNGVGNKSTCVISSLPGPEISLRLASKQIKTVFYWYPPISSIAVSLSFFTYGDHVQMAVMADRSVLPDPELITKDFIYQMEALSDTLANRRIPGEHNSKKMEPSQLSSEIKPEETPEQLQMKMSMVHQEIHELKRQLNTGAFVHVDHERRLMKRVENLKEQFRELLLELRKRKAAQTASAIYVSEEDSTEDDDDMEPRRPFRRRAMSVSSRLSTASVSSTVRPLAASPLVTPDFTPESPLITEKQVPYGYMRDDKYSRPYSTHPRRHMPRREDFQIIEYSYSPSVERRFRTS